MSQTISAALKAHYEQEVRTITTCCDILRKDGQWFYFTSHDENINFNGNTYIASQGQSVTSVASSSGLDVDNVDIEMAITSDLITEADIFAGLWSNAQFEIFEINYKDLTMGKRILRVGKIGELAANSESVNTELRGLSQHYQQSIGRVISPNCDAVLGDDRCKKDLTSFTFSGEVDAVVSNRSFESADLINDDAYFDYGLITWTSGLNNGLQMEVKTYTVGNVLLQLNMPFAIAIGDTFSIAAGCNKNIEQCINKFDNVINFRGFPHVPSTDKILYGKGPAQ